MKARALEAYSSKDLVEYMMEQNEWSKATVAAIDWSGMGVALVADSIGMRTRVIKFRHEWLNDEAQQMKIDEDSTDACPCCGQPGERGLYLMTCAALEMQASQELALHQFWEFLEPG